MSKTIKIPGRLESAETGNVVAGANTILDDTKGKKQNVINQETDAELLRLDQDKQGNLTFDQTPTENSTNPVTSGGVYAADQLLSQAIEAILLLIPSAASALNKLVDMNTMNSSISTATASFKGTYNLVSDLHLTVSATHAQIAAALDALSLGADNNDYSYVQVPNTDTAPTEIAKTERYKFNGTNWAYEYNLNNSGFTSAQWSAINSGITTLLVGKLLALPTNEALTLALAGKQDNLTFDNAPTSGSNNPVKSSGIYTRNAEIVAMINALDTAKQNVLTFDNTPTENSSNPVKSGGVYLAISALQATIVALDTAKQDKLTFDTTPTLGSTNPVTSSGIKTQLNRIDGDIVVLNNLYQALTQSALVIVEPADTWPVVSPDEQTIYRVVDRVNTPPTSYSDYMWNGTTMVLMATYNNAIDPRPKKASQNLVTSGGVFDNMGALDVSELNATEDPHTLATYANLSEALAAIPSDYQKGGMSIKYVHTSDNKYVQYRLMSNSFNTNVANWQGVDELYNKELLLTNRQYATEKRVSNIESEVFNTNLQTIDYDPSLNQNYVYITADGIKPFSGAFSIRVYDVENLQEVYIKKNLVSGSGGSYTFAFFSDLADKPIWGMSFNDVISKYGAGTFEDMITVPIGSKYLVINEADNIVNNAFQIEQVILQDSKIDALETRVDDINQKIDSELYTQIKEELQYITSLTIESAIIFSDFIKISSSYSDYGIHVFDVEGLSKINIKKTEAYASGSSYAFAFYTATNFENRGSIIANSGMTFNQIISTYGGALFDDDFDVPAGAKYLAVCEALTVINSIKAYKYVNSNVSRIDVFETSVEEIQESIQFDSEKTIVCWGDSITAGTTLPNYPSWLQTLLGDNYKVENLGVGSAGIQDISARQGGVPALLKDDVVIPADITPFSMAVNNAYNIYQNSKFNLTAIYNIENAHKAYNPVIIDGVEMNFTFTNNNGTLLLSVNRITAGNSFTAKSGTPIYPNAAGKYSDNFAIFFMGTNNTSDYTVDLNSYSDTLINYHDRCIELLRKKNFLVLGLFNIANKMYTRDNAGQTSPTNAEILSQYEYYELKMREKYGLRFIPLRTILSSQKAINDAVSLGYLTQAQKEENAVVDAEWIAKGCPAKSFMSYSPNDYVHPNVVGYKMIAYYISIYYKKLI